MPWEVYSRKRVATGDPMVTFSKLGRISLNKKATSFLEEDKDLHVVLLWDKDSRKVGIKVAQQKDKHTYMIVYGQKGNGAGFNAKTFLDYIGVDYTQSKQHPAHWNPAEKIMEVSLPVEAFTQVTTGN